VALAGAGCNAEMLSHIHGFTRLHAAALGDALVERRFVIEESAAYRCAHAVIARVVRDRLTPTRRREVHRTLALALELLTPSKEKGPLAGEIARQADRGGERSLAYRYGLIAAEAASERYAYGEALSWLDLAGRNTSESAEADHVKELTARVLEAGGWSEAPPLARLGGPITRGLEREDLDLPVRG
jgi:predicted ATPase